MEWSLSKVIRIEAGTVGVSANDLKALLALYKIADDDQIASLLALARAGRERPWQRVVPQHCLAALLQLIEFEAAASIGQELSAAGGSRPAPDREYARAMLRQFAGDTPDKPVDARVEVRMKRQEVLDQADPPLLFFILDEAATRRLVGGRDVMRGQLRQ